MPPSDFELPCHDQDDDPLRSHYLLRNQLLERWYLIQKSLSQKLPGLQGQPANVPAPQEASSCIHANNILPQFSRRHRTDLQTQTATDPCTYPQAIRSDDNVEIEEDELI
ncbi:hypothetical protein O181_007233 [Austropuccinia psidii MF-1]|uniref:Uncharacterized protein n=1 Tax=Austropuccinia psidii MF-1 TaxID=1389203 RepID=A0A9Q3BM03_9BASI|nr:hypothetical protein [Austropuccinia psidii MF-1]